ncbi:MAG: hypothetical protein JWM90_864 [Thermoleophilia bacterium]|nr:hypothetical protein [Thermoleophilia bacterium]
MSMRDASLRDASSESESTIRLHRQLTIALLVSIGVLLLPGSALAGDVTWDGGGGNSLWSNATNWDGNMLPTTGDDVVIGSNVTVGGTIMVNSVTLVTGAHLTVQGGAVLRLRKMGVDIAMGAGSQLTVAGQVGGVNGVDRLLRITSGDGTGQVHFTSTTSIATDVTTLDLTGVAVHQTASFPLPTNVPAIVRKSWEIDGGDDLDGTIQLMSGAVLAGTGTIGGLAATSATVIAGDPTTGDGELTVDGAATLNGSVLQVAVDVVDPAIRGHLDVTGALTLVGNNTLDVDSAATAPVSYPLTGELLSVGSFTDATPFDAAVASPTLVAPWHFTRSATATSVSVQLHESVLPLLPLPVASSHQPSVASTATTVLLDIDGATDAGSGLAGYVVSWDTGATTAPGVGITHAFATDITATSPTLAVGSWYAHVAAVDRAGNASAPRHVGPFVIVAPTPDPITPDPITPDPVTPDPVTPGPVTPGPTTTTPGTTNPGAVDPGTPVAVAPRAPTRAQVKMIGVLKFATLARRGTLTTTLPVREAGVRVTVQLRLTAKQAKLLKLKLKAGQKSIVIGVGAATSTKAGSLTIQLKLTPAAKAALRAAGLPASKLRKVAGALEVTLTKSKLTSRVAKPVALVR